MTEPVGASLEMDRYYGYSFRNAYFKPNPNKQPKPAPKSMSSKPEGETCRNCQEFRENTENKVTGYGKCENSIKQSDTNSNTAEENTVTEQLDKISIQNG